MTATRIIGVILIVLGLTGLIWGGVFWTREKTVLDIGPIEAKAHEREGVPITPVVGGLIFVAGVVLLFVPVRRRV
jgi:UDP-N-acetylmuramyl pentapeptide phosphotransferase/UDP-N-acetylglucosamine-1-phosphate transferase